jgi:uncharacterized membrane protein
MRFCSAVLHFN